MNAIAFLTVAVTAIIFSACSKPVSPPLQTVHDVDIDRYSGLWYEIARYENRFEKGCIGATAYYTPTEDGISVVNSCYAQNAAPIGKAEGSAYAVDESGSRLKVTFFWPFYGDYWILMLAGDYRYSVVGDPDRKYLWILAREATLSKSDEQHILSELPRFGYDATKLYWTDPAIFNGENRQKPIVTKEQ